MSDDNVVSLEHEMLTRRGYKLLPKPSGALQRAVYDAILKATFSGAPGEPPRTLTMEDTFLAQLWVDGFKVVPVEQEDKP